MAVYIGVDLHVRTQTLCWVDETDGEQHLLTLDHERDDVRAFYSQFPASAIIGAEASGYSLWFHRILEQLGHQLRVGYALANAIAALLKNSHGLHGRKIPIVRPRKGLEKRRG